MSEQTVIKLAAMTPIERNDHKKRVLKLYVEAANMKPAKVHAEIERQKERDKREQQENEWKLTPSELQFRAKEIRAHLEHFNEMISGLRFDIIQADEPCSLRGRDNDMESSALAERLNPSIAGRFKLLQNHHYATDQDELTENNLGPMKWALADTAFAIGVLGGAIYTGAPDREIDKLERGLVHAMMARHDVVKET